MNTHFFIIISQQIEFASKVKIANNIDTENEKSWILFAKSKVKLGQKNDAILALKTYLKSNKSQSIQSLLNQIMVGEPIN